MMTLPRTNKLGYAVVDQPIAPHQTGRIKYQGTYWKAALADPNCKRIEAGEPVQVVGVQGITQLVVPEGYEFSTQFQEQTEDRWGNRRLVLTSWIQKFNFVFAVALD